MLHGGGDVVLLNSDTEVTADWLIKLQRCAYSKEKVATVTPLSNNATLASVPVAFYPNEIPQGWTLEEYQRLIDCASYRDYPEIPTGHGFCLYIRREAINSAGIFDAAAFGRGYGEEEDFCYRCIDYGYRHLLCDDVFVYHKASQSFLNYRETRIEQALQTIKRRHPYLKKRTETWCQKHPLRYINRNIHYNLMLAGGNKNILILIHDWNDAHKSVGGTTIHVYDIIMGLRHSYNFHVLAPVSETYKLFSYWNGGEETIDFCSVENSIAHKVYYSAAYDNLLTSIIETLHIDSIHIHHLIGHYFDVSRVIEEKKLTCFISIHDYYAVCPRINKLCDTVYCGTDARRDCAACLAGFEGRNNVDIALRRGEWRRLFSAAREIIVPSKAALTELNADFPDTAAAIIEHGIHAVPLVKKLTIAHDKTFNIALVGAIAPHKGAYIIEEMVKRAAHSNITLHLFGITALEELQHNRANYIYHGMYARNELSGLLSEHNIKLACILSVWPETYCYTLHEILAENIPVLTFDFGAPGMFVREHKCGWLLPLDCPPEEIIHKLQSIFNDKKGYAETARHILSLKIKSVDEMNQDYHLLYAKPETIQHEQYDPKSIARFVKEHHSANLDIVPAAVYNAVCEQNNALSEQYNALIASKTYRFGKMILFVPKTLLRLLRCVRSALSGQ